MRVSRFTVSKVQLPHSCSLLLTPAHSYSLLLTPADSCSLLFTSTFTRSYSYSLLLLLARPFTHSYFYSLLPLLTPTFTHSYLYSLLLTPAHSCSLLLTPPHSYSLLLTPAHSCSLPLTRPHSYRDSRLKVPIFPSAHQGFPLSAGKMVRVEEIVQLPHQLRVRARLAHPAGWITLLNLETGRPLEPLGTPGRPKWKIHGKKMEKVEKPMENHGKPWKTHGNPARNALSEVLSRKSWKTMEKQVNGGFPTLMGDGNHKKNDLGTGICGFVMGFIAS